MNRVKNAKNGRQRDGGGGGANKHIHTHQHTQLQTHTHFYWLHPPGAQIQIHPLLSMKSNYTTLPSNLT